MNAKKQSGGLFLWLVDLAEFELLHEEGGEKEARGRQREEDGYHV